MSNIKDILGTGRAEFNRRVEAARRADRTLDTAWFSRLLTEGLDPLVGNLPRTSLGVWVSQAFDLGLELSRQGRGHGPMADRIPRLWAALGPLGGGLLPDFQRNLSQITNALFNLERWGGRTDEFLGLLESVPEGSGDAKGIVLALSWRCGLPQLRQAALERARTFPEAVLAATLGPDALAGGLEAWTSDPWWSPAREPARVAGWLGGFAGNDGPFSRPPLVEARAGGIYATSGSRTFRIHADRFGHFLAPVDALPEGPAEPILDAIPELSLDLPREGLRLVRHGRTVVASSPVSFRICVVAA